jgi:hypothetical protein
MEPNISDHLPSELQRGFEEFPTMHGIDLHGGVAACVPGNLLGNPVHFSRTPIVHPPPAPGAHTAEVCRPWLDG